MEQIEAIVNSLERGLDQLKRAVRSPDPQLENPEDTPASFFWGKTDAWLVNDEHLNQILFDCNPIATILSTIEEGSIARANNAFYELTGYKEKEVIGNTTIQLGFWSSQQERQTALKELIEKKIVASCPFKIPNKTGKKINSRIIACLIEMNNRLCLVTMIIKHIRATRTDERKCIYGPIELPEQIHGLSNKHSDLKHMFDCGDERDIAIYDKISTVLKRNVFPFIENLKAEKLNPNSRAYLAIIEASLNTLVSLFPKVETILHPDLTPTEVHIMELIKQGKSSKEIAQLLNVSVAAVSFHRNNIRKKVGLHKKKISLAQYLNSNKKPSNMRIKANSCP